MCVLSETHAKVETVPETNPIFAWKLVKAKVQGERIRFFPENSPNHPPEGWARHEVYSAHQIPQAGRNSRTGFHAIKGPLTISRVKEEMWGSERMYVPVKLWGKVMHHAREGHRPAGYRAQFMKIL